MSEGLQWDTKYGGAHLIDGLMWLPLLRKAADVAGAQAAAIGTLAYLPCYWPETMNVLV